MAILLIFAVLLVGLTTACWSCARSYFDRGRLRGMEEATREIVRGISRHYELEGRDVPDAVAKALLAINTISRTRSIKAAGSIERYHLQLSILGDAIGDSCWIKGHAAGVRRKAPVEGKIRLDLSLTELLQLSWLAHLGFQHMMPNYRGFEVHRFSGEEDALEGAKAIGKIEGAIPLKARPFADLTVQFKGRHKMICDWWQAAPVGRLQSHGKGNAA
jgi:hypothetical protein